MKTRITLVRHAETNANQKRAFSGRKEVSLSPYGYQQIEDLTSVLEKEQYQAIYSSPMTRALETVKPVAQKLGLEVESREELLELSYGELEGTPRSEIEDKFPDVWEFFKKYDYFEGVEGQENIEEGAKRIYNFLEIIARKHPGEHLLVATHGMIMRVLLCYIYHIPWTEFCTTARIKNTSINELEYDLDTSSFQLLVYNDTSHEEII